MPWLPLASPLARRDAARDESCPRAGPLASPHNHHCSEPVPGCTPCCDRRASRRGSRRIWHNRIAGLSGRGSPSCLLRPRDPQNEPAPCSSHFMLLTLAPAAACALADPKQRGRDGRAAVSLVPGLKLRELRVGVALLSPPSSRFPLSKRLSKQREAALVARNTMCSNQSRR